MISRIFCLVTFVIPAVPCWAADHIVSVGGAAGLAFSPSVLTINAGDTVTFKNSGGNHNVKSDMTNFFRCATSCSGSGGNVSSTFWSSTVVFDNPGTFGYFCEQHGDATSGMRGSITVIAAPAGPTIGAGFSGNWYNTAQSGHGFQFEVIHGTANDFLSVFWFTFDNNGAPQWISGVGTVVNNTATVPASLVLGGRFPPNFNPANITTPSWGTMIFTFSDCNHGHVDWNSSVAGFSSGGLDLTRLTQVAGTTCP
jgi:plastocyanin